MPFGFEPYAAADASAQIVGQTAALTLLTAVLQPSYEATAGVTRHLLSATGTRVSTDSSSARQLWKTAPEF
jgi:hypothetical protein